MGGWLLESQLERGWSSGWAELELGQL
jgi:hypothetical protein